MASQPDAARPNEIRMSLTRIRATITMLVVAVVLSLTLAEAARFDLRRVLVTTGPGDERAADYLEELVGEDW